MTTLDDDCENGHIRRIHPWYPRRLRKILRTVLFELLSAFKPHGFTRIIIKPLWNANRLIQLGPLSRLSLLFNVRQIMTHNLYLIIHIGSKFTSRWDWLAEIEILIYKRLFGFALPDDFRFDNSNSPRSIQESVAGIILTKKKSAFSAACKHAIRFIRSLRHKIVDHYTDVGILTTEDQRVFFFNVKRCINTCHQTLRCSFLVTRRTIDLSGKEKSGDSLRLQ